MINILILCNRFQELIEASNNIRRCTDNSMCIISTTNVQEAKSMVEKQSFIIDIFVVAMYLKSGSGYSFEKEVRKNTIYTNTPFVFLTSNEQDLSLYSGLFSYEAHKKRVFSSLPIDALDIQSKFCLYLDAIIAKQIKRDSARETIRLEGIAGSVNIPISEIVYMEIQNKLCTIYTLTGKYLLHRTSLTKVLNEINSENIIRAHRFYAINLKQIKHIEYISSRKHIAHFRKSSLTCPISSKYMENEILRNKKTTG